ETRYAYNADGHLTQIIHPGGDQTLSIYQGDLDPDTPPRLRGNLRERHHDRGSCAGDPVTISEYYQYAEDLGNEHGETNFVVRAEDPRGNLTLASYDQAGNRTSIIHPEPNIREDMQFDANGRLTRQLFAADQHGHRREILHTYEDQQRRQTTVEDPHGLALTTVHEYDAACNEILRI